MDPVLCLSWQSTLRLNVIFVAVAREVRGLYAAIHMGIDILRGWEGDSEGLWAFLRVEGLNMKWGGGDSGEVYESRVHMMLDLWDD